MRYSRMRDEGAISSVPVSEDVWLTVAGEAGTGAVTVSIGNEEEVFADDDEYFAQLLAEVGHVDLLNVGLFLYLLQGDAPFTYDEYSEFDSLDGYVRWLTETLNSLSLTTPLAKFGPWEYKGVVSLKGECSVLLLKEGKREASAQVALSEDVLVTVDDVENFMRPYLKCRRNAKLLDKGRKRLTEWLVGLGGP